MRVKLISENQLIDLLISTTGVPGRLSGYFLPEADRCYHYTEKFEYLERRYTSTGCIMCWLDIIVYDDCIASPVSDQPMMVLVYLLKGSMHVDLQGLGEILLVQGLSYLFYVPAERLHQIKLQKVTTG